MNRLRFSDAKRFRNVVKKYLAQREAENNLVLGILSNVLSGEYREIDPYMAVVEDQGEIIQVLLRTPPFPVLFSYRQTLPPPEGVDLVVEGLRSAYGDEIGGMTGDQKIVEGYAEAWSQATGHEPVLKTAMRIYKLEEVKPVEGVPGEMRLATRDEQELLISWFREFQGEALGETAEEERLERSVRHYLNGDTKHRRLVVWEVDGEPVSMAGYSGPTPHGIRISAVYTPPDQRRQGYASACVAALSQHLLERGYQFCFLFTDLENPTSNHIYQEIGYRAVSDVDKYIFQTPE